MSNRTTVTLNGTDVSSYLTKYEITDVIGNDLTVGKFEFHMGIANNINLTSTMTVVVTRYLLDGTTITLFRGYVTEFSKRTPIYEIRAADKHWLLSRQLINYSYDSNVDSSAGNISKIAYDIAVTRGGMSATWGTEFQDSGSTQVLSRFICRKASMLERIFVLSDSLGWQFYYSSQDDKSYFQEQGYTSFTDVEYTLKTTSTDTILGMPEWRDERKFMINQIEIVGEPVEVETTEQFSGDGVEDEFTLSKIPVSVKVYVDAGGGDVLQTGGMVDSTSSYDYYIDEVNKKIIFVTASIPPVGVDNVTVNYSYYEPINLVRKDQASIDSYGLYEARKVYKDVLSVEDAIQRSNQILNLYSNPIKVGKLQIAGCYDLRAGMKVQINDRLHNVNDEFIVTKIIYRDPQLIDEIEVVSKFLPDEDFLTNVAYRVKRLEDKNIQDQDLLLDVKDSQHYIDYNRRYLKVQSRDIGDAFILDHLDNAVLDTSELGEGTIGTFADIRVTHPNRLYIEQFYDTDFLSGTGGTGMVWNTTHDTDNIKGRLQHTTTGTGTATSTVIWNDNAAVTSANITMYYSGTPTLNLISGTGNSWESVTLTGSGSEVTHTFSGTGNDVYWQIIMTGSGDYVDELRIEVG